MSFFKIFSPRVLFGFAQDLVRMRHLVLTLSLNELKKSYAGSYLSILWAFIQPAATILILTFLFAVGFRSTGEGDFPFELWLSAAMIPWLFISAELGGGTRSIGSFSALIKKMSFQINMIPVVHVLSLFYVHFCLMIILHILFAFYGFYPDIYNLQLIYFMFAAVALLLGITYTTASISLFFRDLPNIVAIVVQFLFWTTPIFWSIRIMPEKYRAILELNPFYYITEGYRMSMIHKQWFWEKPELTIYYWSVVLLSWLIGSFTFRKLKPHIPDVV